MNLTNEDNRAEQIIWRQFWSAHQRFFKYLCIAAKVKYAVSVAREAVRCGKCAVIGLQSTGEARTLDQLERDDGELTDFISTAKSVALFIKCHKNVIACSVANDTCTFQRRLSNVGGETLSRARPQSPSTSS